MRKINESRRVICNSNEVSCRYLNIDLPLSLRSATYTGRFGQALEKLGVDKLPFGITLPDLILCGALVPSLYVALPREYFDDWINFPEPPRESKSHEHAAVGMCSCQSLPQQAENLNDLLHPYDGKLKLAFREQYQASVPASFLECEHPNGSKYISAEAYLPYWQLYALADSFHKYRHAESFLSSTDGRDQCLQLIKFASETFSKKYGQSFDRLSWYKTIAAGSTFSQLNVTNGELLELAQTHSNVTADLLKEDLRMLLELDANWHSVLKQYGCAVLEKSRSSLSKDVYLIYEQLRLLGMAASTIFEDFSSDLSGVPFTPLHDVLQFEGHGFKKSFISFGTHYCGLIREWGYECTAEVFDSLIQILGFDAWIHAFHNLHETINNPDQQPVSFRQNRIVDALIVMAVRTEVVLREMFRASLQSEEEDNFLEFFKSIESQLQGHAAKIVETCYNEISNKTKLHHRPDDLFVEIDKLSPKNWSKKDAFFLRALLTFITARNYFAHHAYKDDVINIQTSEIAKKILESLLATLLFFQKNKKQEVKHVATNEC